MYYIVYIYTKYTTRFIFNKKSLAFFKRNIQYEVWPLSVRTQNMVHQDFGEPRRIRIFGSTKPEHRIQSGKEIKFYFLLTFFTMSKTRLTPGTEAPRSGQYQQVWPRGGTVGRPEITAISWKPLPPTPEPGMTYVLVDPTRH